MRCPSTPTLALYYNKSLLQSAGIDPTLFDQAKGPVTWDQVAQAAAKVNKQDSNGNFTQMGFAPYIHEGWHYTYGFSWGGKFFDYTKCEVSPDDPPIVDAFTWVQNYCKTLGVDKLSAFSTPVNQPSFNPAQHPFHLGNLAFWITGDWEIASIKQYGPSIDYGITWMPVPKAGDASVTWAGGWSVVIPQGAKNVNDGWDAVKWLCGPEGSKLYSTKSAHLSPLTALASDTSLYTGEHAFFAQMLPTAKNRPPLPVGSEYWTALGAAWDKNNLGQGAPADLLKGVKDQVDGDLKQYCPISAPAEASPAATPAS